MVLIFGGTSRPALQPAVADRCPRLWSRCTSCTSRVTAATRARWGTARGCTARLRDRYRPYPFLREEYARGAVAADLVIGRAGSSTLAEVTALGLPMVVVPYPHAAGHQRANARVLVEAGGALLVEDDDFDAEALLSAAAIVNDLERHGRMSRASLSLGRPGAAAAVAELVLAAAERRPAPDAEGLERLSRGAA